MEKAKQVTLMLGGEAKWAKPEHYEALRHLCYAMILGDFDTWYQAAIIFASILTPQERIGMTWAGLATLDDDQREAVTATLLADQELTGADTPQAPLFSHMDQAEFWADLADDKELEAYCLASFNRMHPNRQAAFLQHVQGEGVT